VINVPESAGNENVSAVSVVTPNGYNNLEEFSPSKFKSSAKQAVTHFLRELDEYFSLRKPPQSSNPRSVLKQFKTILQSSGSQLYIRLSGPMKISRLTLRNCYGDKRDRHISDVAYIKTVGTGGLTRNIPSILSSRPVWHRC
jgi:hypothetical protein